MSKNVELLTMQDLLHESAFINGTWVDADDKATVDVMNPADGSLVGRVPDMKEAETERAIAAAKTAQPDWAARPARERAAILKRWNELVLTHQEPLARILTTEQGKPLAESRGEIAYGASFVEWFSEEAKRVYGETIPALNIGQKIIVQKQPIGVAGLIIPWNFPSALFHRKVAAALAAGCTVVLKPSEFTPFSALALAHLGEMAGVPAGVVNVVTGMPVLIGKALMASDDVRKVSFTGSTRVGKLLIEQSASTVKKLSLELGGNAPLIVFDDADIPTAVEACMNSKFRNAGQTCVCANRIYVQDGIYEAFSSALSDAVATLKVGSGFEEDTTIGPLINDAAIEKVERHISDAVEKGGKIAVGGARHGNGERYFTPTVLIDAHAGMELAQDETFGPVAPLFRFSSEREAIELANATQYGLASYIFTQNLDRMWRVTDAIETGMVGVNEGLISNEVAPFGGVKQSGLGREGSSHGINEYLEQKYILISANKVA